MFFCTISSCHGLIQIPHGQICHICVFWSIQDFPESEKKHFRQASDFSNFSGRSLRFKIFIYFSISLFDNSLLTLNTKLVNVVADETHFVCPPSPTNNPRILTKRSLCIKKGFFIQTYSEKKKYLR